MKQPTSLIVVPPEEKAVVKQDTLLSGINIESLIAKAVDSKSAVEVLKELRAMELDYHERSAKAQFDEAMSAFQSECPVITKDRGVPDRNGKIAYKYSPIESIEVQIRPLLRKHGFSHTFDTDTASEPGWVISICIVTHSAGHSRSSKAKFPLGTKTTIMSDTQVYASALTFANRRALQNAYGLIIAGDDMDGATGKLKPQGPSSMQPTESSLKQLASDLWATLKPVRGTEQNWKAANQFLWDEGILSDTESAPDLNPARFQEVIAKSKERLAK